MHILYTRNIKNLAIAVAQKLNVKTSEPIVRTFPNQEIVVSIQDNVQIAVVIACLKNHDDWIELFFIIDALKSVGRKCVDINVYITYFGYGRQTERKSQQSCGSMFFANILDLMSANNIVTINNHNSAVFSRNTINLNSTDLFLDDIRQSFDLSDVTIVAPDIGAAKDLSFMARRLRIPFAICNKHRNIFGGIISAELMGAIHTKHCIIIDDLVESGNTLEWAAKSVITASARNDIILYAYVTHGLFVKKSHAELQNDNNQSCITNLKFTKLFKKIVITDTIEQCAYMLKQYHPIISVMSVKEVIAKSIYEQFCDAKETSPKIKQNNV